MGRIILTRPAIEAGEKLGFLPGDLQSKIDPYLRPDVYKRQVMGCVVNGPGEAKEADLGVAGGIGEGLIIKHGEVFKKVPESELLGCLLYTSRCV